MKILSLQLKDICVNIIFFITTRCRANDENALEVDFEAVNFSVPHLTLSSSIGNGVSFVSKFITSKLSGRLECAQPLVDYLLSLNHQGDVRGTTRVQFIIINIHKAKFLF